MKVAEAGVILGCSSNQTNFFTADQWGRGCTGPKAEAWPSSIPSNMVSSKHSFYSVFHPGWAWTWECRFSCISCWQCPAPRPVKGVLAPSFHWGPCPAPSYRDNLKKKKKKRKTHHSEESGIPSSFRARCLSTFIASFAPVMLNCFWFLSGHLIKGLKSPLQPGLRSYIRISHSTADVNYSFSL